VQIIGLEAGGHGIASGKHAAPLTANSKVGVLHGNKVYLIQDENARSSRHIPSRRAGCIPA